MNELPATVYILDRPYKLKVRPDDEHFLRKAADLLERRGDSALLDLLDAEARANTWGARADEILCALESPLPAAEPTRRFPLGDKKAIPGI